MMTKLRCTEKASKALLFCFASISIMQYAVAQQKKTLLNNNPLHNISSAYKYRNEFKNIAFIQGGSFMMREITGHDSLTLPTPPVRITTAAVLIAKYETSNAAYRQFVQYVKDSIMHTLLKHFIQEGNQTKINWKEKINWKDERLDAIMLPIDERIMGKKELDVRKLTYKLTTGEEVAIYPDTLVWQRDFKYAYNEPFTKNYFSHPGFENYPVVGVNQKQAIAYCEWKTKMWNNALLAIGDTKHEFTFRLPTNIEWEFAAIERASATEPYKAKLFTVFDKTQTASYTSPIKENNTNISNKAYRYNFGVIEDKNGFIIKDYADDGFFYVAPCDAYQPNDNGIYNLSGNVAEWTSGNLKKYVIVKGGSWNTIPYYLQPGANQYFEPTEAHSYLGFRVAIALTEKK